MSSQWSPCTTDELLAANSTNIPVDLLLLEKKRMAKEKALQNLNKALLEETLVQLRGKAQQLQNNKWMFTITATAAKSL